MPLCKKFSGACADTILALSASASHDLHAYVYVTCSSIYNSAGLYFKISFDLVVETMLDTGKDLNYQYRETSEGGLAKKFR